MTPLSLVSPGAWRLLIAIALVDIVLCAALGLRVAPDSFATAIVVFTGASLLAWVYAVKRPAPALAMLAMSLAYLVVATPLGAIFSYAVQAMNLPMWDSAYAAADDAMGLDWMATLAVIEQHPTLAKILRGAYASSLPHVAVVLLVLAFTNQHDRLREFLLLFMATAMVTCFISGLLPAIGTFAYYAPPEHLRNAIGMDAGVWHVAHVTGLRDGSFQTINLARIQGLVTFPSFHTALALLCGWATWTVRGIAWPSALLAALIIAATPHIGGHYFIDLTGGGAIAVAAIWLSNRNAVEMDPAALPAQA